MPATFFHIFTTKRRPSPKIIAPPARRIFFLFDKNQKLVYRGQFDDSRPSNGIPVTGKDLRAALDAVLAGKPVPPNQKASMGCNIKWKAGNEPDYF